MDSVVCHRMSHIIPFWPNSFTCKSLMQWVIWSGSRTLIPVTLSMLNPHLDTSLIFFHCPVSWRSWIFGLIRPVPRLTLAVLRWGRCWDRPTLSPEPGPGLSLSWSYHPLSCAYDTTDNSPTFPWRGWGQLFCLWQQQAAILALPSSCLQSQLSSTSLKWGKTSSPECQRQQGMGSAPLSPNLTHSEIVFQLLHTPHKANLSHPE